jgi:lipoprotein-releasing system permease protein
MIPAIIQGYFFKQRNSMPLKGEIFLAWKYLKPQKSIISVLTYTSLLGPLLGVGILIVVVAVMNGIPREYEKQIVGYTAHIQINSHEGPLKNYDSLLKHLESNYPEVKASPVTLGPVLIETMDQESEVFLAKGVLPEFDREVSQIKEMLKKRVKNKDRKTDKDPEYILEKETDYSLSQNEIIISINTQKLLNLKKGDFVILHSPEKYRSALNEEQTADEAQKETTEKVKIAGFYSTGVPDIDTNIVLVNQKTANRLMILKENETGQIELGLKNPDHAEMLADTLQNDPLLSNYRITPWQNQPTVRHLKLLIKSQKSLIVFVLFFIVVGAAIGVAACLFSVVIQKTKEIGILKATGMQPKAIILTFLGMGTALGILGSGVGTICGLITLKYRQLVANSFGIWDKRLYKLESVPAYYDTGDICTVFFISVLICAVAAMVPAAIAASINPVKALQSKG